MKYNYIYNYENNPCKNGPLIIYVDKHDCLNTIAAAKLDTIYDIQYVNNLPLNICRIIKKHISDEYKLYPIL